MATSQKIGKNKNMTRSGREKSRNSASRQSKINNARKNHVANAKRSCGVYFSQQLEKYYQKNPVTGTKCGRREKK
jgi:hypothetical protein